MTSKPKKVRAAKHVDTKCGVPLFVLDEPKKDSQTTAEKPTVEQGKTRPAIQVASIDLD